MVHPKYPDSPFDLSEDAMEYVHELPLTMRLESIVAVGVSNRVVTVLGSSGFEYYTLTKQLPKGRENIDSFRYSASPFGFGFLDLILGNKRRLDNFEQRRVEILRQNEADYEAKIQAVEVHRVTIEDAIERGLRVQKKGEDISAGSEEQLKEYAVLNGIDMLFNPRLVRGRWVATPATRKINSLYEE